MKCPNCGNEEDFEKCRERGINFNGKKGDINFRKYCLKCGYKFSKFIEKRYN